MNHLFSNIIYNNNRNQINRNVQTNIRNNFTMNHIMFYNQNTYNTINRRDFGFRWRSNISTVNNTNVISTDNTDNSDHNINEPILNIPLNSVIPLDSNHTHNIHNNEYNDDDEYLATTVYNNDEFNSIMRINNLNSNSDPSELLYHSVFEYNNYNIRYNHQDIITPSDADAVLQNILNSIFEEEVMNQSMNYDNVQQNNSIETQQLIESNIYEGKYCEIKDVMKNDVCPISMESFLDSDLICLFSKCNHGIHHENKEQFIKLFKKCPLCNDSLT